MDGLNHESTLRTTAAERAIALTLQASCQSPVATFAQIEDGTMTVTAMVAMPDGSRMIRDAVSGPAEQAEALGIRLAEQLLDSGAGELLAELEANSG